MDNIVENNIRQLLETQTSELNADVNEESENQITGENVYIPQYVFEIPNELIQLNENGYGDNNSEVVQYATICGEFALAHPEQQHQDLNSDVEEGEELELTTLQMMEVNHGNDYDSSIKDDDFSSYTLADHVRRAAIIAAQQAEVEEQAVGRKYPNRKKLRLTDGSQFVDSEENDESESGDEAEQYGEYSSQGGAYSVHREGVGKVLEGARLKLAYDGSIILDNGNPNVDKKTNLTTTEGTRNDHTAGYSSTPNYKHWSLDETCQFYKLLNTVGSDFTLMQNHLLNRNRTSIKRKYKREEKIRSELVDKAMHKAMGELTHAEIMDVLGQSAEYGKSGKSKRSRKRTPQIEVSNVSTQVDEGSVNEGSVDEGSVDAGSETGTGQSKPKRKRDRKVFFDRILYI